MGMILADRRMLPEAEEFIEQIPGRNRMGADCLDRGEKAPLENL